MRHKIKYAKTGQVINVIFKADREIGNANDNADDEDDALIIKFARKTNNQQNIKKLQESKHIAAKIVSHNLADQSFTLKERLKARKYERLEKKKVQIGKPKAGK